MPTAAHPEPIVPVPACDPVLTELLRAATECYIRGDYQRAVDLWLDAAAVARTRPDATLWLLLADQFDALLKARHLRSRPIDVASSARRLA